MDINVAKQAGAFAAQVEAATAALAAVDEAIAGGAVVTLVQVAMPDGRQIPIFTGSLDTALSAQGLQFVRSLYQTRLDAVNAALGAL